MRIAFFGLPIAALLLHADGHDIVHAALCRPHCPGERRLTQRLGAANVSHKPDPHSPSFTHQIAAVEPDIIVSWFWTTRLPKALIALANLGGFGVHPSLLPRHRGPDPYFWAIDSGDAETGVTAHELDETYDTGAILGQRRIALNPTWNAWTLAKRLDRPSLALLRETAREFAAGRAPTPQPQSEKHSTEAPAPSDELLELDWTLPAERILRRVRAASPSPGAYTFIGEQAVTLTRVEMSRAFPKALEPGEAAVIEGRAVVRAGDFAVALLEGTSEDATVIEPNGAKDAGATRDNHSEVPKRLCAADLAELVLAAQASS